MNTCFTSWWSPIYNIYILRCFFFFFSFFYFFLYCASTLNVSLSTYLYKIMFCYLYIKINYQLKRERIICVKKMLKNEVFFKKNFLFCVMKQSHFIHYLSAAHSTFPWTWCGGPTYLFCVGWGFTSISPSQNKHFNFS